MRSRRLFSAAAAAVIAVAVLPLVEAPGAAADAFEDDQDLFRAQNYLLDISDSIELAVASRSDYSTLTIDPNLGEITVWWRSEEPDSDVKHAVEAASGGVPIEYRVVEFTEDELMSAGAEISERDGVYGVRVKRDMSGLEVIPLAQESSSEKRQQPVSLSNSLGVPVSMLQPEVREGLAEEEISSQNRAARNYVRRNDTKPFHAGGRSRGCTTGPAMVNPQGYQFLLTALHCGKSSNWTTPTGNRIGYSIGSHHDGYDVQAIRVDAGVSRAIIDGPWNANSPEHFTVTGSRSARGGSFVCKSGATTGTTCGLRVDGVGWSPEGKRAWWTTQVDGSQQSSAPGDSGSAVFSGSGDGNRVTIWGVHIEGYNRVRCTIPYDVAANSAGTCSRTTWFSDIESVRVTLGSGDLRVKTAA